MRNRLPAIEAYCAVRRCWHRAGLLCLSARQNNWIQESTRDGSGTKALYPV